MPAGQIDVTFIKQYESELYEEFQAMGNAMRSRVRVKTITGISTRFPKFGMAPKAMPKTRKGKVPLLEILSDTVEVSVVDYYGADMIDSLDKLKTNVDEKAATQRQIVQSLGRTFDIETLKAARSGSNANDATGADDSFSSDAIPRLMLEKFGQAEAMSGGDNHAIITWKAWADLLQLASFVSADYGGDTQLTSEGQRPKMYYGFHYAPYSLLTNTELLTSSKPTNIWFHKNVLAVAINKEITASVDPLPEYDADFIMGKMSLGAVLLDSTGVVKRRYGG
jgi:hypothetical protein